MTAMSAEQREAGRQLDGEIAERVMGWTREFDGLNHRWLRNGLRGEYENGPLGMRWAPSEDIRCAFQVVEAMRERFPGWIWEINLSSNGVAVRCCRIGETPWTLVNPRTATGTAALSLAICLAALATNLDAYAPQSAVKTPSAPADSGAPTNG